MKIRVKISIKTIVVLLIIVFLLVFIACFVADPPLVFGSWDQGLWDVNAWGN